MSGLLSRFGRISVHGAETLLSVLMFSREGAMAKGRGRLRCFVLWSLPKQFTHSDSSVCARAKKEEHPELICYRWTIEDKPSWQFL